MRGIFGGDAVACFWEDFRERVGFSLEIHKIRPSAVTPHSRGSVDYSSTRGIQVDVGVPDATSEKSGRVSFVRGALPK